MLSEKSKIYYKGVVKKENKEQIMGKPRKLYPTDDPLNRGWADMRLQQPYHAKFKHIQTDTYLPSLSLKSRIPPPTVRGTKTFSDVR